MKILFHVKGYLILFLIFFNSCKSLKSDFNKLNVFSIEDEVKLGLQLQKEIESNPTEYPILPEVQNKKAYQYIAYLTSLILNSNRLNLKNAFTWDVKIIKNDKIQNAFCTPGGHIYVYTGLIKFLDSEDELLGVLGHEIAHADLRHSTEMLTKQYGLTFLADALLGSKAALGEITKSLVGGIASLKFSRLNEAEADARSVFYLCNTNINAAGAAGFFKKMENQKATPEWLSTHPNPKNRVQEIEKEKARLSCLGASTNKSEYIEFKKLL